MPSSIAPERQAVFLNVPYDRSYERNFIALIASLVAIGRKPRCVLELPEHGQGRLPRLMRHIRKCKASVHDLSRVGTPPRFNMPFELGLVYSIKTLHKSENYHFVLLESTPHRLGTTLSDMDGHGPLIHEGRPSGVITCMIEAFAPKGAPSPNEIYALYRRLLRVADSLRHDYHRSTVFSKPIFEALVASASLLASTQGMIRPTP